MRTDEHAISKGEIFFARPTTVAELTRGEKPIHLEQHSALPWNFVFQKIQQLADCGVGERAGQTTIADESLHMQVFDRHDPAGRSDLRGEFVKPVESETGNLIVQSSKFLFRFQPVLAPLGAACQVFIELTQFPQVMGERSLVLVLPAIRERCQSVQPNIDTDRGMGDGDGFIGHFDGDRDEPPGCLL